MRLEKSIIPRWGSSTRSLRVMAAYSDIGIGGVAQLVEQSLCKGKVAGSIPAAAFLPALRNWQTWPVEIRLSL